MSSVDNESLNEFLEAFRTGGRSAGFYATPASRGKPVIAKLNFETLRKRFQVALVHGFQFWDALNDSLRLSMDMDDCDPDFPPLNPLVDGCKELSIVMIQQLYLLLAHKARQRFSYDHQVNSLYDPHKAWLTEIPDGCACLLVWN